MIIIDDYESACCDLSIQRIQCIHCRLVKIAIQTKNSESFNRRNRKRIFEPPRQEFYLIIQQPVSLKKLDDCLLTHYQEGEHSRADVKIGILWMSRRWNTLERVRNPND